MTKAVICSSIPNIKNIIWIDENINSEENKKYVSELKKNCCFFSGYINIEEGLNKLYSNEFILIVTIVSGKLWGKYLRLFKKNINKIINIPYTFIFTSNNYKDILLQKKPDENKCLSYDTLIEVNDPFYNPGGVTDSFDVIISKIQDLEFKTKYKIKKRKEEKYKYEGALTFEYIKKEEDLLAPALYKEIITFEPIKKEEVKKLIKYFLSFCNEDLRNLIFHLNYFENIPIEILSKYFIRCYTIESDFYKILNNNLMNSKMFNVYHIFIKFLYMGIEKEAFLSYGGKYLYRGTKINKVEKEKIMDYKKNGKIHDIIVFSKAFLSFSKDENEAMNFIGIPNKETYGVLYILENYNRNTSASNAYIEELSAFPEEKEILFFPGSSFIIKDINDLNNGIMKITLNYHGKFQEYYDIFSKSKNSDKEIILSNTTSLNEILDSKKYNSLLDESDNDSSYLNSLSSIHQLYEIKTEINNTKKKTKQIVSKNKSDNLKLHSRHNKRLLLSQRKEKEEKNEISSKELKENSKELKDSNPASDSNSIITLSIEKASCDIGDIYDRIVEPKIIEGKKLEFFKNGEYLIINNNIKIHDYSQLIQRVMKARNLKNNEIVLIKEFDGTQDKEYFKELIKLIKKIRDISQHFSGLKNIFQISSKYFMVVDIYEGNLYDYLKRIYPKGVPPNLIKKIIFQLGSTLIGLKDGEGQRAINPKNILIKYTNENKNNFDVFLSENGIYEFENDIFSFYFYHSKVMNYRIIYKNPFCQYGNLNDNN